MPTTEPHTLRAAEHRGCHIEMANGDDLQLAALRMFTHLNLQSVLGDLYKSKTTTLMVWRHHDGPGASCSERTRPHDKPDADTAAVELPPLPIDSGT